MRTRVGSAFAGVALIVGVAALAACGSRGEDSNDPRRAGGRDASAGSTPTLPKPRAPHRLAARDVATDAGAMIDALERGALPDTAPVAGGHVWRSFGASRTVVPARVDLDQAKRVRAGFPDLEVAPVRILTTEDRVFVEGVLTGKHTATFAGIAPTGKQVGANVFYLGRLRDGEIVESIAFLAEDQLVAQLKDGRPAVTKPTRPPETHRRAEAKLDPDGFQDLHQITAFAVAAQLGGDAPTRAIAAGEMTPAQVRGELAKVKDVARTSPFTIGIREIFGAGPHVVARFKLTMVGRRAAGKTIDALAVASVRGGRVDSARVYTSVAAGP